MLNNAHVYRLKSPKVLFIQIKLIWMEKLIYDACLTVQTQRELWINIVWPSKYFILVNMF